MINLISLSGIMLIFCFTSARSEVKIPAPHAGNSMDGTPCNLEPKGPGSFDYSKRHALSAHSLDVVEHAHFTPEVENLIRGNTSTISGDLDYTLGMWPNHHKALLSVIRFQLQIHNKLRKDSLKAQPECYLQRAIQFSPEDPVPYALYGHYLHKLGHLDHAGHYYKKATEIDPDNAKFAYSYSLLLIDLKEYDNAVKYAKIAYQKGNHTPKGLKAKLDHLGFWKNK